MNALKIIKNIALAFVATIVICGAAAGFGMITAFGMLNVIRVAAPSWLVLFIVAMCHDSAKASDEEKRQKAIEDSSVKEINIALDDGAIMPTRAHEADAGYDLYLPEDIVVGNNDRYFFIDTGVHIEIPKGYYGTIKARSGLNKNKHMTCQGVIDSGYTGTIGVKMYINERHTMEIIERGTRIAQLIIVPIVTPELKLVDELDETDRGNGGFGSTGEK